MKSNLLASPGMIDKMGDKASAKATMKAASVPTIPGSDGLLDSFEQTEELAAEMGYPVMLRLLLVEVEKMRAVWNQKI